MSAQTTAKGGNSRYFFYSRGVFGFRVFLHLAIWARSGGRLLAVSLVPVLLCCCQPEKGCLRMGVMGANPVECLDVFFFRDDLLGRLDAYQRFEGPQPLELEAVSTRGPRRIVVLANSSEDRYTWAHFNSYEGLSALSTELRHERPQRPVMSGECLSESGEAVSVTLTPLLAEIVLQTLSVDFHGTAYAHLPLEDIRIYLTNVNGRCSPFAQHVWYPQDILNEGGLRPADLSGMLAPEMLFQTLEGALNDGVAATFLRFYGYPNEASAEGYGTPFTRLVIEGKIGGETWYYPIDINRDGGSGLQRGMSYHLDVTLTRKGVSDPDTPIGSEAARLTLSVLPWKAQPERLVTY